MATPTDALVDSYVETTKVLRHRLEEANLVIEAARPVADGHAAIVDSDRHEELRQAIERWDRCL